MLGAAEDSIVAAIQTRAAIPANPLSGVVIQVGTPNRNNPDLMPTEAVFIPEESTINITPELTGSALGSWQGNQFYEIVDIPVVVFVTSSGDDFTVPRARAEALMAEVITACAGTITGAWDSQPTIVSRLVGNTDLGYGVQLELTVEVRAVGASA